MGVLKLGINERFISSGDLDPIIFWKFFLPDISSFEAVINLACAPASDDSDCAKSVRLIRLFLISIYHFQLVFQKGQRLID